MDMENKDEQQAPEQETPSPDRSQLNPVENFYERFRDVPLRYIDRFIALCVAALLLIVVLGMLDGRGFF